MPRAHPSCQGPRQPRPRPSWLLEGWAALSPSGNSAGAVCQHHMREQRPRPREPSAGLGRVTSTACAWDPGVPVGVGGLGGVLNSLRLCRATSPALGRDAALGERKRRARLCGRASHAGARGGGGQTAGRCQDGKAGLALSVLTSLHVRTAVGSREVGLGVQTPGLTCWVRIGC